jgi:DNA-binding response OmpR family regulator
MTKILLVEDDAPLLEVMCNILEAEGFEIVPACNGKDALDSFVSNKPDLIISDIMMPEMDGYELLESVRVIPNGVTVPFLFLSARTQRADVSRARMLGVDDYLFKPFDSRELIDAVHSRIDRRRAVELFDTRSAHLQTVIMLANVIEARDPYTAGHLERVRRLALNLAFALDWTNEEIVILEFGAILHHCTKPGIEKNRTINPGRMEVNAPASGSGGKDVGRRGSFESCQPLCLLSPRVVER